MKHGGTVIESGGFGCIFKPQIKCDPLHIIGNTNIYDKTGISKIMRLQHGLDEYDEIIKFIPILKTIPNYKNYFIISQFTICRPVKLTKSDLKDYDTVNCSSLKKKGITKDNINDHLSKLLTLNMPYGGIDLDCYISKNLYDSARIIEFNNKMIDLLDNAILPMNKKGIYHSDLKANNILVNNENGHLRFRLIDWGLSTIYFPGKQNVSVETNYGFTDDWKFIPDAYRDRPFQFNVPFSCILFSTIFKEMYELFLITNKRTHKDIRDFLQEFVKTHIEYRGSGHLSNFKSIFSKMYGTPEFTTTIEKLHGKIDIIQQNVNIKHIGYIIDYLCNILIKYTKNEKFDVLGYLNEVYIKNVDIWGFVMTFLPLTEQIMQYELIQPSQKTSFYRKIIHTSLKDMINILLKYSSSPINIDELKKVLLSLNKKLQRLSREPVLLQKLKQRQIQSLKIRSKIKILRRKMLTRKKRESRRSGKL